MSDSTRKQLVLSLDQATPPSVRPWLASLEDTSLRTWEALEGMSHMALDWSDEEGTSIGSLLYHVAAIELDWVCADILEQPFPLELERIFPFDVRDESGKLTTVRGETLDVHWQRLERVRSYLITSIQDMSPAEFVRVRQLPEYDVSPLWVLHHLMQHEADHRGQIMALRMRATL